jgi:DNA-binding IclR family transcriptional regulator
MEPSEIWERTTRLCTKDNILKALAVDDSGMTLNEIRIAAGGHSKTTSRCLQQLVKSELVEAIGVDGTYRRYKLRK